uniref:Tudor domain-containing protein n=1 Tax=Petromyzon marinus TaxID=7757 RepID=S4RJW4_PETMA
RRGGGGAVRSAAAVAAFRAHMGRSDDSDIWDDTALIKAYDKAVTSFKVSVSDSGCELLPERGKPYSRRLDGVNRCPSLCQPLACHWRPGDLCQAAWSEDGVVYDATIKSVDASAGTCVMVFTGYGNEDELKLADLLPPAAESAARAGGESDAAASCDADAASRAGKCPILPPSLAFLFQPNAWGGFPPPPPHLSAAALPPTGFGSFREFRVTHQPFLSKCWIRCVPTGSQMIPPPPLPPSAAFPDDDDEALGSMLLAWYMSGYHTGYYQGLKQGKKDTMAGRGPRYK